MHNESCRDCKSAFLALLIAIFGKVDTQYDLNLPARLEDFATEPYYLSLAEIHEELVNYRGHSSFVRTNRLPRVDYYIPDARMVLEFDESQHFTRPRLISLESYPPDLSIGYDQSKWMDLARTMNRRDGSPIDRDEQRAWYDTLRDFSSAILGNAPTRRVYARDFKWCSLDSQKASDVRKFMTLCLSGVC